MVLQTAASAQAMDGRGTRLVTAPRIDAVAVVDGLLDEPVWAQSARLTGFSQFEPVDGRAAEERTEVLVWYAPDAIHFGIVAYDRQAATIRATRADRDNIGGEDHVTIYLDTFNDRRRAFFFAVNALGVQQDGIRSEGASSPGQIFGGDIDRSPDYLFDSSGRVTAEGYVVEVRIPFKSLRYPGTGPQSWGLNIVRKVQRTGYTDTWTDVRRASASFLAQAGTIDGLHDLRRGVVLEAQPFVTAAANGARGTSGAFERGGPDTDAGVNLRLGLTNVAFDATVNPDFSQVESDAGQVTVNERFALFFPEKRPFFLEGIDLFSTPNQLVYTRRINDPVAGGKVTGKLGPVGVAHLTGLDDVLDSSRDAVFNVTRLRRDFGANSLIGVTFTDRSVQGTGDFNRVAAADMRLVFARLYFLEAQLGRSWTRDLEPLGPGLAGESTRAAPIWKLMLDRTGRSFGFNYSITGIGEDFETRAGYVPRGNIVDAHVFNRFSFYGARGALVESVTAFFGPSRIWRYDDFGDRAAIEGRENVTVMLRLRGGWQLNGTLGRDFVDLDPAAYADYMTTTSSGPRAYAPLDRVSGPAAQVVATTPTFRGFDASATLARRRVAIFAEGSEGTASVVTGSLSLRPTEALRVAATNTYQRITRSRDGSQFAAVVIPRLKLEYQPTRAFFLRAVTEYQSNRQEVLRDARTGAPLLVDGDPAGARDRDDLRIDLLASFEPRPGTVAFFGYGSSLAEESTLGATREGLSRVNDGFFLKLAYQFRR
jgi:hypothetical protein